MALAETGIYVSHFKAASIGNMILWTTKVCFVSNKSNKTVVNIFSDKIQSWVNTCSGKIHKKNLNDGWQPQDAEKLETMGVLPSSNYHPFFADEPMGTFLGETPHPMMFPQYCWLYSHYSHYMKLLVVGSRYCIYI